MKRQFDWDSVVESPVCWKLENMGNIVILVCRDLNTLVRPSPSNPNAPDPVTAVDNMAASRVATGQNLLRIYKRSTFSRHVRLTGACDSHTLTGQTNWRDRGVYGDSQRRLYHESRSTSSREAGTTSHSAVFAGAALLGSLGEFQILTDIGGVNTWVTVKIGKGFGVTFSNTWATFYDIC